MGKKTRGKKDYYTPKKLTSSILFSTFWSPLSWRDLLEEKKQVMKARAIRLDFQYILDVSKKPLPTIHREIFSDISEWIL